MQVKAISWNLFHGRDKAPEPGLHTLRSRLLGRTERGATHAQVNTDLRDAFVDLIAEADWDIALLQECPPRWAEDLVLASGSEPHLCLTSRNLPGPLRTVQSMLATLNPDLIASWEGGSNLTLVRGPARSGGLIVEREEVVLTRTPETRRVALTRLANGLCIGNLHASGDDPAAAADLRAAAAAADTFAAGSPLILGGDFNLAPRDDPATYDILSEQFGLDGAVDTGAIDHILYRGLGVSEPASAWTPESRERPDPSARDGSRTLPIRLSDHDLVEASFELAS